MYHCQSWSIRLTLDTDRKHRDPPESNGKSTRLSAHLQPGIARTAHSGSDGSTLRGIHLQYARIEIMPVNRQLQPANFGLLPEPERSTVSFVTSAVVNGMMLALLLYVGATARHVIQQHQIEQTILI